MSRTAGIVFSEVDHVVIRISVPTDQPLPSVATPVHEAVVWALGYEVSVEVQFVQIETVGYGSQSSSAVDPSAPDCRVP